MCNNAFHIFLPSQKADNFFQRERKLHFRCWGGWGRNTNTKHHTPKLSQICSINLLPQTKVKSHVRLEADFGNYITSLFRWLKKKNSMLHFFIKIGRLFLLFLIQKYRQVTSQTSLKNGLLCWSECLKIKGENLILAIMKPWKANRHKSIHRNKVK